MRQADDSPERGRLQREACAAWKIMATAPAAETLQIMQRAKRMYTKNEVAAALKDSDAYARRNGQRPLKPPPGEIPVYRATASALALSRDRRAGLVD